MTVKVGIYRDPNSGHTIEYFPGAEDEPVGYEYIGSAEDFEAGKTPEYVPPGVAAEESKARSKAPNKARTGAADKGSTDR
jgi:hypothetical protein